MINNLLPYPFCGHDNLFVDEIDYSNNPDIPEECIKKLGSVSYAVVCYDCNSRGSEKIERKSH